MKSSVPTCFLSVRPSVCVVLSTSTSSTYVRTYIHTMHGMYIDSKSIFVPSHTRGAGRPAIRSGSHSVGDPSNCVVFSEHVSPCHKCPLPPLVCHVRWCCVSVCTSQPMHWRCLGVWDSFLLANAILTAFPGVSDAVMGPLSVG